MDEKQRQESAEKIAERIKKIRSEKGLSQTEAADHVAIARSSLANYENPTKLDSLRMSAETLLAFAEEYGVSTDYLLGRTDEWIIDADAQTLANILGFDDVTATQNLIGMTSPDKGLSPMLLAKILCYSDIQNVMEQLVHCMNVISRQKQNCESSAPERLKQQCDEIAYGQVIKATRCIEEVMKEVLGYNDLLHIINEQKKDEDSDGNK